MPITDEKMYKYTIENIHSIEIALKNSSLATRKSISEENIPAIKSFTSLTSFLLGAWAEIRLTKLLYERDGFSEIERTKIKSQSAQIDRWLKAIEISFRKHFHVPRAELNADSLPYSAFSQYKVLVEIVSIELRNIIEIRNKLAHGQWIYPMNNDYTDVETEKFLSLRDENILSLQFKQKILQYMTQIIHDLVVSRPAFDRDFDKNYKNIINTKNNLKNRSFEAYKESLVNKRIRGRIRRNNAS